MANINTKIPFELTIDDNIYFNDETIGEYLCIFEDQRVKIISLEDKTIHYNYEKIDNKLVYIND